MEGTRRHCASFLITGCDWSTAQKTQRHTTVHVPVGVCSLRPTRRSSTSVTWQLGRHCLHTCASSSAFGSVDCPDSAHSQPTIYTTSSCYLSHWHRRARIKTIHEKPGCVWMKDEATTSIKWNKSLLTFNVWLHYFDCCSTFVQCLLVCVCVCVFVCVCVCVLVCFSLCVIIVFFSDCRIYLFSSLAARVFNKLTHYSLLITLCCVMSSTQIPNVTKKDRLAEIISWLKSRMASLLMTLGVTSTTVNLPEFHFSERKIFIRVFYRRIWNRNDNFNYHTIHNQGQKRHKIDTMVTTAIYRKWYTGYPTVQHHVR